VGANNEIQYFDGHQVRKLLEELRRLRRLCRREEFFPGLDVEVFWSRWKAGRKLAAGASDQDFQRQLDRTEAFLEEALVEGRWLVLEF
jgi:hypothetical protein